MKKITKDELFSSKNNLSNIRPYENSFERCKAIQIMKIWKICPYGCDLKDIIYY